MKNKHLNNQQLRDEAFAVLHALSAQNQPLTTLSDIITNMTAILGKIDTLAKERARCIDEITYEQFLEVIKPKIANTPNKEQMLPKIFEQLKADLKKPDASFFKVQQEVLFRLVEYHKNVSELQRLYTEK